MAPSQKSNKQIKIAIAIEVGGLDIAHAPQTGEQFEWLELIAPAAMSNIAEIPSTRRIPLLSWGYTGLSCPWSVSDIPPGP